MTSARLRSRSVLPFLSLAARLWSFGCGYTTRPGLPSHFKTVYVKPFANKVDITQVGLNTERFPIYRHRMEVDLTNALLERLQFTGILRPAPADRADTRLEGELIGFSRDALRYDQSSQVEEWRLNLSVHLRFFDQTAGTMLWEEERLVGDTTYLVASESESAALARAITDLARRIVERLVENW